MSRYLSIRLVISTLVLLFHLRNVYSENLRNKREIEYINANTNAYDYPDNIESSYFAICAMMKNEHLDIREWIEYHKTIGTGKFYLFDHGSVPPMIDIIFDYVSSGLVTYYYQGQLVTKVPNMQVYSYDWCIQHHRRQHRFIGFIDIDEFIFIKSGKQITEILPKYEKHGGLTLNWMIFSSSGHVSRPTGGVVRSYTKCTSRDPFLNKHVKSIVNTEYVNRSANSPHWFHYNQRVFSVDVNEVVMKGFINKPTEDLFREIYLNHYITKSEEDFERKSKKGGGTGRKRDIKFFHDVNAMCNDTCPFPAFEFNFTANLSTPWP